MPTTFWATFDIVLDEARLLGWIGGLIYILDASNPT